MSISQDLKGTQTEKNLMEAFIGESQARNKYSYYSDIAISEGFEEVAKFFEKTANNEKFHAKTWYKLLNGDVLPNAIESLENAMEGENYEHTSMYPEFAKIAEAEGFNQIASLFIEIAQIEKMHEEKCREMLKKIKDGNYKPAPENDMFCMNCGFDFSQKIKLRECPVCGKTSAYFATKA